MMRRPKLPKKLPSYSTITTFCAVAVVVLLVVIAVAAVHAMQVQATDARAASTRRVDRLTGQIDALRANRILDAQELAALREDIRTLTNQLTSAGLKPAATAAPTEAARAVSANRPSVVQGAPRVTTTTTTTAPRTSAPRSSTAPPSTTTTTAPSCRLSVLGLCVP